MERIIDQLCGTLPAHAEADLAAALDAAAEDATQQAAAQQPAKKMNRRQRQHWDRVAARNQPAAEQTEEEKDRDALAKADEQDARIAAREQGQLRQPNTRNAGVSRHRPNRCSDAVAEPVTKIVCQHPGTNRWMPEHQMFGIRAETIEAERVAAMAAASALEEQQTRAAEAIQRRFRASREIHAAKQVANARREERDARRRAEIRERVEADRKLMQEAEDRAEAERRSMADAQKRQNRIELIQALGVQEPAKKPAFAPRLQNPHSLRKNCGSEFRAGAGGPCNRQLYGEPRRPVC